MEAVIQMELFPNASEQDILMAKRLLQRFTRMKSIILELAKKDNLTEKENQVLIEYRQKTTCIEMAVSLIVDDAVRRVMEFRFIRGNPRWGTIKRFSSVTDRSIDRQIVRGIESVAETLKIIGVL
ncbi:hypothetical protein HW560_15645 [Paenibacillus sp. E222]|uniref:hypothetical protein n=1 Tax=Paenibacillus sp. E222 TaxID=2748863 RepID=UPI0015C5EAD7|nr:hypothetical protein [Paenibacillus sp. E222]QLG39382.1 hypothetical protein HW560_15645 [Paenibacillus sp. E222]